ncbi:MAG: hypothetical protein IH937_00030 [Acidobacteria bacterium]|nr:hypothetical protein [Acidobacteriota bacterium]
MSAERGLNWSQLLKKAAPKNVSILSICEHLCNIFDTQEGFLSLTDHCCPPPQVNRRMWKMTRVGILHDQKDSGSPIARTPNSTAL